MAQAWASPAVSTAGSQAEPKIPTSCRRSSDRSQTVVRLPACLAPQFEPHVVPSRRVPRLSSLALTRIRQRLLGCRIFTPAQPSHSAASSEGFLLRRLHLVSLKRRPVMLNKLQGPRGLLRRRHAGRTRANRNCRLIGRLTVCLLGRHG